MEALLQEIGTPLIAVLVPIAIAGVKWIVPRIPKMWLPILAGAFGPAVEAMITWLGDQPWTGTTGVTMGFVGVALREILDQTMKALRGQGGSAGTVRAAWPATILALLLATTLVACGGTVRPETPRERLVVAEEQYQAMLATVINLTDRGIVTAENRESVRSAVLAARSALDTWQLHPDSFDSMSAGLVALQAAQAILNELERRQPTSIDPSQLRLPPMPWLHPNPGVVA